MSFWVSLRPRLVLPALVLGATLYTFYYVPNYFNVWKKVPVDSFRRDLRAAVDARQHKPVLEVVKPYLNAYSAEELRYYLIRWGGYSCHSSAAALDQLQSELDADKARRRKRPKR
jgi:hypothetical protein